jgi:hypothetical protein
MPKTEDIINGLQSIVNNYSAFAIVWHAVFYLLIVAILFLYLPSNRILAISICLPALSVAIFAWLSGNPFNGALFLILAVLTFIFGLKASGSAITYSQLPYMVIGILMIVFGLVYPHFITANSFIKYLYASPAGLIPCPTLSILIGLLLLYNGFGSHPLTLTFIVFGLFYGIFGFLKLAVHLDIFLVVGTLALIAKYFNMLRA